MLEGQIILQTELKYEYYIGLSVMTNSSAGGAKNITNKFNVIDLNELL